MWRLLLAVFCWHLVAAVIVAQNGTAAAGLAGAGAGAALSAASGQGSTTPSSFGSGGSPPIEEQIMVFNGLEKIATDIATITAGKKHGCESILDNDGTEQKIELEIAKLEADAEELKTNRLPGQDPGIVLQELMKDIDKFNYETSATRGCQVLIVDPTMSNQLALYQAAQAYYRQLTTLRANLRDVFALHTNETGIKFVAPAGSASESYKLVLQNQGSHSFKIKAEDSSNLAFGIVHSCVDTEIAPGNTCTVEISFKPPADAPVDKVITGDLKISTSLNDSVQTIQLSGQVTPATADIGNLIKDYEKFLHSDYFKNAPPDQKKFWADRSPAVVETAPVAPTGTGPAPSGSPPSAPATVPLGFTYLGDIMTALAGSKGSNTYAPSSFQPTTQSLAILVEAELLKYQIHAYTSTSTLNLEDAIGTDNNSITFQFSEMLTFGNQISDWTTRCKPPTQPATSNGQTSAYGAAQSSSPLNSGCQRSDVVANLAAGQQLITGYTAFLSSTNDGSGNPIVVDVLRGKILSDKITKGILALQLNVAGAGGSSKTNNPFFLGLFYQWAPSYNAGVIATYEIRDENNLLLASGARNVLFGYGKWNPGSFEHKQTEENGGCSFCSSRGVKPIMQDSKSSTVNPNP